MPLVVFRADGGVAIGAGHVMRSLALAQAFAFGGWQIGFAASRATFSSVRALAKAAASGAVQALVLPDEAADESITLAKFWPGGADILVVDHYDHDAVFDRACRNWAERIVVIDDLANRPHEADVLVDMAHPQSAYRNLVSKWCEVLAGPEYAIINPAFLDERDVALSRRNGGPVERVLVSFGQIDSANATLRAVRALNEVAFTGQVDVALGSVAPHRDAVQTAAGPHVKIHIDAQDMPRLMAKADLAIGAGGVTAMERCSLGLPSILVALADNQRHVIARLKAAGAAIDAGETDSELETRLMDILRNVVTDSGKRVAMAAAGSTLVDGRGAQRITLAAIGPGTTKQSRAVTLRLADAGDESWLLALQSQPETRRYANNPAAPTQQGHRQWLKRTLADRSRLLIIVEVEGRSAGMLRLDRQEHGERVNIAIDPQYHGQGVGVATLALVARLRPAGILDAEVLPGNKASLALFTRAGYRQVGERLYRREPR
jgi:UDP-2,4-diacetamido-2,4,6-trideoxy-beta-L-altropyranose hydrolase